MPIDQGGEGPTLPSTGYTAPWTYDQARNLIRDREGDIIADQVLGPKIGQLMAMAPMLLDLNYLLIEQMALIQDDLKTIKELTDGTVASDVAAQALKDLSDILMKLKARSQADQVDASQN